VSNSWDLTKANESVPCAQIYLYERNFIRSADERREAGTNYRDPEIPKGARGPGTDYDYIAYVFVFLRSIIVCRLHKWTLPDQAPTDSLSDLV